MNSKLCNLTRCSSLDENFAIYAQVTLQVIKPTFLGILYNA